MASTESFALGGLRESRNALRVLTDVLAAVDAQIHLYPNEEET